MRTLKGLLLAAIVVLLAACGTDDAALTTLQEEMEEAGDDAAAAIANAQEELADIGQRIQESEAAGDLQTAWEELQAELTEFFTEGTVDREQLEQIMDDFEAQLDAAGDQIGPEIREAWGTLRAEIERLIQQAG